MEPPTDSSSDAAAGSAEPPRSVFCIDLNEIPSPQETLADSALDVVRNYHDNPSPPPGVPAVVPGGGGGGEGSSDCAACGNPEALGHVVVCDGCERGFHLGCAGMRGLQDVSHDEWVCGDCGRGGVRSKRWPVGVKSKQILDINSSPPSDGDDCCADADAAAEDLLHLRKHTPGGNSFGGNPFGAPVTHSNFLYSENGFGSPHVSGIVTHTVKEGFEDILHRRQTAGGRFEEKDVSFQLGRHRSSNNTTIRIPMQNSNDIVLQALKDFVSERHGVLEEGWHVEFKQSIDSEPYVVYCAPNGKTFDSLLEVQYYLGLMPFNSLGPEVRRDGSLSMTEKVYQPRKRKSRVLGANGLTENKEILISNYCKEPSSHGLCSEVARTEENGNIGTQQNCEGLPVQFEDFFVLSLGKVDTRPSYHGPNYIWPIGYRSCWHDRITASLFICEVLDGGDTGPFFKVKRCSCSALPIPNGSTILSRPPIGNSCGQSDQDYYDTYDNDGSLQMILLDPSPPMENDMFSCLRSSSDDANDAQASMQLHFDDMSVCEKSGSYSSADLDVRDDIGEISVEDHSPSSAWRMISQKIANACSEIFKQKGVVKFCCKHVKNASGFYSGAIANDNSKGDHASLDKFCSSPSSVSIPSISQAPGPCNDILLKWLDQDRFGLDMDFVQELLEQLPDAQFCSQYQFVKDRRFNSTSLTIGNGLLVVKKTGLWGKEDEVVDGLFRRSKKAKLDKAPVKKDHPPPLGKPLCSRIPPALVGDVYQIWEFWWRFHEVLGQMENFSLKELEGELINPWFSSSDLQEKLESEIQGAKALNADKSDDKSNPVLSCSSEFDLAVCRDNPHAFVHVETGEMKEAAAAKLAYVTYNRCSGIALTKAHTSLLRLLIGELQSKVAALVDPNFDSGEFKSKRGRKKDIDCSIPLKRSRLLPINELTWPELARRYILAVLAMDGSLDSAEIIGRESTKVFRCLQGDGGVLCGSLTGVAGMEADALLLAQATKKIFPSLNRESHVLTVEEEGSGGTGTVENNLGNDGIMPAWALVLEPVRKLPTNVGTRIRKCVYEALEKDPPEWAKKILEHSISKEVYKGNASGPTKKAVVSVLADVATAALKQKTEKGTKRKINISISDVIMKQCRIVLRSAAAVDDTKVFCNLLGRKLMSSSDNDDEGLLGSPGMVSRPLDFRTIDLRLAAGSYGGSHEAFLEDVRQLWSNLRIAYGDQPELVELVETLSQKFETLYEEVVSLDHKLAEYAKLEGLSAETKKEIDDLVALTSDIPKAPWDEGVCKVCGIDKDDDSVLLCDTCDAEYHTYCLNPPLARIPKGNWYCPSCVVAKNLVQDAPGHPQAICRRYGKKSQGEVTRVHLESLTRLASKMEESEYWEFNVDERAFLLKFLCDELLNSAAIHQHLEHCSETSTELQQKLRSLTAEWKNLKSREEFLVARAAKVDASLGEDGMKEVISASVENQEKSRNALSGRSDYSSIVSNDLPEVDTVSNVENNSQNFVDIAVKEKEVNAAENETGVQGGLLSHMTSENIDAAFKQAELPSSNALRHEFNGSSRDGCVDMQQDEMERIISPDIPSEQKGPIPADVRSNYVAQQRMSPAFANDSPAYHLELNSVKNDLSLLHHSISAVELELSKVSVRREFLGIDSVGGFYWATAMPGKQSRIIVDRSMSVQQGVRTTECRGSVQASSIKNFAENGMNSSALEGSKALCSYSSEPNNVVALSSPWVSYQTDAEIKELVGWLKVHDSKERELRESILHWKKTRFRKFQQTGSPGQDDLLSAVPVASNGGRIATYNCLVTRAATFLEKLYGPCFQVMVETADIFNKQVKRGRLINDEKMYRCGCLEPILPYRRHCFSCHRTFFTDVELEGHNDGRCFSGSAACEKDKETSDSSKVKGSSMKAVINREECRRDLNNVENSKSLGSELSAKLIKFQNEGLVCPYDLEEVCSKFVTNDSNKELTEEIGLIGSKGIPSFLPHISPCLNDSTLAFISTHKDVGEPGNSLKAVERRVSERNTGADIAGCNSLSGLIDGLVMHNANKPTSGFPEQRDTRPSGSHSIAGDGRFCVVPQSSLRPLVGKVAEISRRLKINLLDMEAALSEEALRPSKAHLEKRWAWRTFVKSAATIYEIVQATIVLEDMIKTEYLRNEWWYWSSYSAAAKTSTISSLSLRIYSLDAAILYEKMPHSDVTVISEPISVLDQNMLPMMDSTEKMKISRKINKKRKEPEG